MRPRRLLGLGLGLCAVWFMLSAAASVLITESTLRPARRLLTPYALTDIQRIARRHTSDVVDVAVTARDGATLRAWRIRRQQPNGRAVLLLHGLGDNRAGMNGYADLLLAHGFTVLMPDARAHGASDGQLATYGLLESDDIGRWLEWLRQDQQPTCIFALAESMGAAQLLQSLATGVPVCAAVAESPFSSFREIAYDRVGQFFETGPFLGKTLLRPVVEMAFVYARWKYGTNFEAVSPEAAVSETTVPILLIHGGDDRNIPIRHSRAIAERHLEVRLWEVPGADHCEALARSPQQFGERVLGWFEAHGQAANRGRAGVVY